MITKGTIKSLIIYPLVEHFVSRSIDASASMQMASDTTPPLSRASLMLDANTEEACSSKIRRSALPMDT